LNDNDLAALDGEQAVMVFIVGCRANTIKNIMPTEYLNIEVD
jgi:hypothetical protein